MSQANNRQSAADQHRARFEGYSKVYIGSWPGPDPIDTMGGDGNAALGAQSAALKRQVKHNDRSTTQTSTVTGA